MQGECAAAADVYYDVTYGRSYQISADTLTLSGVLHNYYIGQ